MTISLSQIQKVIQVYDKQTRNGVRIRRGRNVEQGRVEKKIPITSEDKRQQVIERVTTEIMAHLINGNFQEGGVESEIMTRLNQETGETLKLAQDHTTGQLIFHVIDNERGEIIRTLDQQESDRLMQRLIGMAREIVDQTML
ncbi:MAG: hypothetical protein JRI34_08970 [Deltaproteobacteria bacterium]|nr:hypothetical protein [Deltaproteobacteria bacterium]